MVISLILIDTGMGTSNQKWILFALGIPFFRQIVSSMVLVVMILQMFYDAFALIIVEEVCNKDKTGYEPAFKKPNFGLMKTTGNGLKPNPRKHRSCPKIFYQCRKADN
jgi:hypothetical protein